jgi:hypothetical protein
MPADSPVPVTVEFIRSTLVYEVLEPQAAQRMSDPRDVRGEGPGEKRSSGPPALLTGR